MAQTYFFLFMAIGFEVMATSAMQASQQFTKTVPTVLMIAGYAVSLYFLALTLRGMPVGIAYAIWSGLGIVLISLIGLFAFGQRLDFPAVSGIVLIVAGVLVIHLFSKSIEH